jgi:hypothetical protein
MGIDTSKAGQLIAEQMEAIENDYADQEGFQVGAVVTMVQIEGPDGGSNLRIRHNLGNPVMLLGMLRLAEDEWIQFMRQGPSE